MIIIKTVLITGASSGIGYALAEVYAKHSHNLILVARREEKLKELKEKLENRYNISILIEQMDLSKKENLELLVKKYKYTDILINNAGFGQYGEFSDYTVDLDISMINLNILTPVILAKYFAENMKIGSKIINIASTAGFQPIPLMATYGATKSFIVDFPLAIQKAYKNLKIALLCPGETQTEFQQVAKRPKSSALRGYIPTAQEVALYFFNKEQANKSFVIHGFYNRLLICISRFFNKRILAYFLLKIQKKEGR